MYTELGDMGDVAQACRHTQVLLQLLAFTLQPCFALCCPAFSADCLSPWNMCHSHIHAFDLHVSDLQITVVCIGTTCTWLALSKACLLYYCLAPCAAVSVAALGGEPCLQPCYCQAQPATSCVCLYQTELAALPLLTCCDLYAMYADHAAPPNACYSATCPMQRRAILPSVTG